MMAKKPLPKSIVLVFSILLMVIGWMAGVVAFAQNFGDIKINNRLFWAGLTIVGIGIVLALWVVISYAINRKK